MKKNTKTFDKFLFKKVRIIEKVYDQQTNQHIYSMRIKLRELIVSHTDRSFHTYGSKDSSFYFFECMQYFCKLSLKLMKSFKKTNFNNFETDLMTGSIDEGFFSFRYYAHKLEKKKRV